MISNAANCDDDDEEIKPLNGDLPNYIDTKHPGVARTGTRILHNSLAKASLHAISVADLWDVFSKHVQAYQYGQFTDTISDEMMTDLRHSINLEYRTEIIAELRVQLKRDLRADLEDRVTNELEEEIRVEREADIRVRVEAEIEEEITAALHADLRTEIRPQVEAELRAELMSNDSFIADAKREIQRKALGL